jgi:hypothetical protein
MKKFNLIKFLKSNEFAITVAILSVLVQSFHSYTAFYNMSSLKGTIAGIIQAVLFAIVVDLAILFYTVRGKKDVVLFASVFLFVINGYYYFSHWGFSFELIFAAFLSLLVPITQYFYSEAILDEETQDIKIDNMDVRQWKLAYNETDQILNKTKTERDEYIKILRDAEKKNHELSGSYFAAVEQRDALRNSNSVLSEAVGRHLAENHEVKKRLGDLPQGAVIDLQAEGKKIEDEIQEIQDRSLLNVQDRSNYADDNKGAYNPIHSNKPVV